MKKECIPRPRGGKRSASDGRGVLCVKDKGGRIWPDQQVEEVVSAVAEAQADVEAAALAAEASGVGAAIIVAGAAIIAVAVVLTAEADADPCHAA